MDEEIKKPRFKVEEKRHGWFDVKDTKLNELVFTDTWEPINSREAHLFAIILNHMDRNP